LLSASDPDSGAADAGTVKNGVHAVIAAARNLMGILMTTVSTPFRYAEKRPSRVCVPRIRTLRRGTAHNRV
jgi:hypothetical protein